MSAFHLSPFNLHPSHFIRSWVTGAYYTALLIFLTTGLHAQDRPVITPASGLFLDSVAVTIISPRPDAEIHFTIGRNAAEPSLQSPLYTGPVMLNKTSRISARMYKDSRPVGERAETVVRITSSEIVYKQHPWNPQPKKAALMVVFTHADDDGVAFTGLIPYYAKVRKVPLIGVCTHCGESTEYDRWRRKEAESAFWTYGMRNAPLFAGIEDADWSKHQAISHYYDKGDFKKLLEYLVLQIRTYQPDVVVSPDFYGEYLHTHHLISAYATHDAFFLSNDPAVFPEQLSRVQAWQAKKLYAHIGIRDRIEFDWSIRYPELGGRTPREVAREGTMMYLSQFVSQPGGNDNQDGAPKAKQDVPVYGTRYGLLKSYVGPDVLRNDLLEHIVPDWLER